MRAIERAAYWTGGLLILSGVIHLAMLVTSGGTWAGPLSLRKPATFGLSFGLTLINVTLIASFVPLKDRSRTLLVGLFTAACVLETFLVSLQTWRGVPSHFNVETPLDAAIAQTLALGGFTLVAIIIVLTVIVFRRGQLLPLPFRRAIQAGFVALVGAQVAGGAMIATGMRLVFGGDPQSAYATGGWLKPVHGVLMHGILVLPLIAWLMAKSHWDERRHMRGVHAAIAVYALVVTVTLITTLTAA